MEAWNSVSRGFIFKQSTNVDIIAPYLTLTVVQTVTYNKKTEEQAHDHFHVRGLARPRVPLVCNSLLQNQSNLTW